MKRLQLAPLVTAWGVLAALGCGPQDAHGVPPGVSGSSGSAGGGSGTGTGGSGTATSGGSAVLGGSGGGGAAMVSGGAGSGGQPISAGAAGASGSMATGGGGSSSSVDDPGTDGDGSFKLSGPYQAAPEMKRMNGVPQGKVIRFTIPSSTIYPKAPPRDIAVYVPQQYEAGTPAAVMVFQDGTDFYGFDGSIPPALDNLIAQKKIPPLIGVFTGNGGGDSVGSERGLEYDTVSGLYAEWADKELLPAVEAETKTALPEQAVTFTKDPEGRGAMGGSSGGAASFSMVWWRPDLFRRVITFSGTYVNQVPRESPFPHGAWVYHDIDPYDDAAPNGLIKAFCESASGVKTSSAVEPCDTPLSEAACLAMTGCAWNATRNKPIRVWLQVGTNDNGASGAPSSYRNFRLANERMAQALAARGYHVHFDLCEGAGHVDQGPLRQTLPAGLTWLWRGYKGGI